MDIAGLIERLEKADGPDRELDARIAVALGDIIMRGSDQGGWAFWEAPMKKGDWAFLSNCRHGADKAYRDLGQCLNVKKYTASVDAALALVERKLPGWVVSVCHCHISDDAWLAPDFNDPAHSERLWREFGQVPGDPTDYWQQLTDVALHPPRGIAIAACISLLRALQAQEPHHD